MLTCIISALILSVIPDLTSWSEWTASGVTVTEEWSLNVMDRIDSAFRHLGDVYGVESEAGFHWHTILVAEDYVLHFEDDSLIDSLRYDGDIDFITFSPNHRYLLGYSGMDRTMKLFDFDESTVKYQLVFSHDMEFHSGPSLNLTDDGEIIAKHSTYLRIYDADFNVIISKDDFEWGGSFIGMTDDGSRMYSSDDFIIRAFNENAEEIWSTDLPATDDDFPNRYFTVSNTGEYLAVSYQTGLYLYDAITGNVISEYRFEADLRKPEFSENDRYLIVGEFTHPEVTPLRPEEGFGLILLTVAESALDIISEFYSPGSRDDLPNTFSNYRVANDGTSVGMLYYAPGFLRIALFSNESECQWMSGNASLYEPYPSKAWFIEQQQGISADATRIWYYDGRSLHACIVGGI